MRSRLYVAALLALSCAGCGSCGAKTGWRFEVLAPPVVMSPAIVQSGAAPLGAMGLGTFEHRGASSVQLVQQGECVTQQPFRPMQAAPADCASLAEACDRIRALEAAMRRAARPEALPMPRRTDEPIKEEE